MKLSMLALVIASGVIISSSVMADNTIKFRGEIIDTTCSVDPSSNGQTVSLGKIGKTAFESIGATGGSKPFSIAISGCSQESTVDIKFSGTPDANNPSLLQVSSAGEAGDAAEGVGIAIYRASDLSNPLPLGEIDESQAIKILNSTNLNYVAKYVATVDPTSIKAGMANADAQFTVQYF